MQFCYLGFDVPDLFSPLSCASACVNTGFCVQQCLVPVLTPLR